MSRNRLAVRPTTFALAVAALILSWLPGAASLYAAASDVTSGTCVQANGGNSCTANDVTFIAVGLGTVTNLCLTPAGTMTLFMGATLNNTTATNRYDVGMWVYTGPSGGNAYSGSTCAREALYPPDTTDPIGYNSCPNLDQTGGNGPFLNLEGNICADLRNGGCTGTNASATSFMVWPQPITIACTDTVGPGGVAGADGFADIYTCATWGNSSGQVGCATTFNGTNPASFYVVPGTGSKCNCAVVNSNVPQANFTNPMSCSCSPQLQNSPGSPVRPGDSATCTVSFNNTRAAGCSLTYNASAFSPAEKNQCGTGGYLRFKVGYSPTQGQVLNLSTPNPPTWPNGTPTETTGGTVVVDTTNNQVVWTPRDTVWPPASLGIIGPGETGSMTYQFYVDKTVTAPTTINQTVTAYYSNASNFSPETANVLTGTCTINVTANATWASVVNVRAAREDGRVALRWDTAAEAGTHAFEIERKDAKTGKFVKVTDHALPALSSLPGGSYRWIDDSAPAGASTLVYRIVELEQSGGRQTYGPFTVAVGREGLRNAIAASDEPFAMYAKGVSARVLNAAVSAARSGPRAGDAAPTRVKVETVGAGMVRVDATAIAAALRRPLAQINAQLSSGRLALSHLGSPVAWQPTPGGPGLAFYAQAVSSAYTEKNVYWIDLGSAGTAIQTESVSAPLSSDGAAASFAESLHLEEDHIGGIVSPTPVADYWIWQSLAPGYPGYDTANLTVTVPHPVAGGGPRLALTLYGFALEQEIELHVNGRYIDDISWSTPGRYIADVALPDDVLVDGANSVEIVGRQGSGGIWLDAMDLQYKRALTATDDRLGFAASAGDPVAVGGFSSSDISVFDLADAAHPQRLSGARTESAGASGWRVVFVAPSGGPFVATTTAAMLPPAATRGRAVVDLRAASNAAQYVVLSPAELRSQANRLAAWRAQQGLSTMVVDVEDVMDGFADGVYDPLAIKRFLANARQSWQTAPRYVALLGKGSFDYKNTLGLYSNLLPPLLVPTGDAVAPADAEYADFDGNGVPEMAVGRIPALTVAEAKAYVDKLIAYESSSPGQWSGRALMVADNPDKAGSFQADSDTLASSLAASSGTAISRVYLPSPASAAQLLTARNQLLSGFNTGFGLLNYVGHGGLDRLATEGLLLTTDVPQLGNGPRLPVMTALTCLISQFAYPTFSSLGEDLVLQPSGGVVALYGPTWLSYDGEANRMGGYVVPEIERAGTDRLGDRLLRGLAAYAQSGSDRVQLSVYTLLGDPAVRPPR